MHMQVSLHGRVWHQFWKPSIIELSVFGHIAFYTITSKRMVFPGLAPYTALHTSAQHVQQES